MYANNPAEFIEEKGLLGWFHFLVFPVDLLLSGDEHWLEWRETRFHEVTPILSWLIPFIVFLSCSTSLSDIGLVLLFIFEVFILTFLSAFYLANWKPECFIELGMNYTVSLLAIGLTIFLITFFWEILIFIGIALLVGLFREHFTSDYDDE